MLAQFQARYPTSSLISELLTIYQGKFVVRVLVQIDGVTRATGMAAAETPELAEDTARSRAIALMTIEPAPSPLPATTPTQTAVGLPETQLSKTFSPIPAKPNLTPSPSLTTTEHLLDQSHANVSPLSPEESTPTPVAPSDFANVSPSPPEESTPTPVDPLGVKSKRSKRLPLTADLSQQEDDVFGDFGKISDPTTQSSTTPPIPPSNVTPFVPRSYELRSSAASETQTNVSEPIDLSDAIAKTDVEMERIGWGKKDGKDYLLRTYGKPGRTLLTEEELLGFLRYLESQPSKNK